MKTTKQVWWLSSGPQWSMIFDDRVEAIKLLADQEFLDNMPTGTLFMLQPAYQVVEFEVPGTEYWGDPKPILMITDQSAMVH